MSKVKNTLTFFLLVFTFEDRLFNEPLQRKTRNIGLCVFSFSSKWQINMHRHTHTHTQCNVYTLYVIFLGFLLQEPDSKVDIETSEGMGRVDEGVEEFFTKKIIPDYAL